jgi:ACS family hexuronate transporter-like MFS transporter
MAYGDSLLLYCIMVMGWFGIWLALVGELSRGKSTGLGLGLSLFFANLGLLFGPPLFGILTDISGSFVVAWYFLALCMGLSCLFMIAAARRSTRHNTGNNETGG